MCRINRLLISQSNLQASETKRRCKSVCSTYAALSSSVCYSVLNHLLYNLLTIISYRFIVSKIFFFFHLKITGFPFKNTLFKVYSQQNQNTMELNVGVYMYSFYKTVGVRKCLRSWNPWNTSGGVSLPQSHNLLATES